MEISKRTAAKLKKYGYDIQDLDDAFRELPLNIFQSEDGRHFKSKIAVYDLHFKSRKYTLAFSIMDGDIKYEFFNQSSDNLLELLCNAITYMESQNMLRDNDQESTELF